MKLYGQLVVVSHGSKGSQHVRAPVQLLPDPSSYFGLAQSQCFAGGLVRESLSSSRTGDVEPLVCLACVSCWLALPGDIDWVDEHACYLTTWDMKHAVQEFSVTLGYVVSSRAAWAT